MYSHSTIRLLGVWAKMKLVTEGIGGWEKSAAMGRQLYFIDTCYSKAVTGWLSLTLGVRGSSLRHRHNLCVPTMVNCHV